MELETRAGQPLKTSSQGMLTGYAAVFNSPSLDLGGFREIILPGAFKRSLATGEHVRALYNHNADQVLGRVGSGTLRLSEDETGLRFELDLPPTTYARDLAALVERRDVAGCSFAFAVRPGGENWETRNGESVRILSALNLEEITITARPAYPDTSVAKRGLEASAKSFWETDTKALWLETV